MLWGKKILEWSAWPRAWPRTGVGIRTPTTASSGCSAATIRPGGRPIFGTVRRMSSEGTARTLRVRKYPRRYGAASRRARALVPGDCREADEVLTVTAPPDGSVRGLLARIVLPWRPGPCSHAHAGSRPRARPHPAHRRGRLRGRTAPQRPGPPRAPMCGVARGGPPASRGPEPFTARARRPSRAGRPAPWRRPGTSKRRATSAPRRRTSSGTAADRPGSA